MSQSDQTTDVNSPAKDRSQRHQSSQDEDGFIDIQHDDADFAMQDSGREAPPTSSSPLELQRYGNNLEDANDVVESEEDSEDDQDPIANHPLLSMLTGRLGARRRGSTHKWDHLHPENQALSVANIDQCSALEEAAFPPEERASREKVMSILGFNSMNIVQVSTALWLSAWMLTASPSLNIVSLGVLN